MFGDFYLINHVKMVVEYKNESCLSYLVLFFFSLKRLSTLIYHYPLARISYRQVLSNKPV